MQQNREFSAFEPLTRKEREAMSNLSKGMSDSEIAIAMGISKNTVKHHLKNIYSKYSVNTRFHAVQMHRACSQGAAIS